MNFPFLLLLMAIPSLETAKDSDLELPEAVSDSSSLSLSLRADSFFNQKTLPVSCFLYPVSYVLHLINTNSLPMSAVDIKTKIISFFISVDFCVIERLPCSSFPLPSSTLNNPEWNDHDRSRGRNLIFQSKPNITRYIKWI